VLVSGLPLRDYRADVVLTPEGTGTRIEWSSSFRPKIPGTGRLYRAGLRRFIADTARRLADAASAAAGESTGPGPDPTRSTPAH